MTDINPIIRNFDEAWKKENLTWKEVLAQLITDDPQAHVDALVEAGVLTPYIFQHLKAGENVLGGRPSCTAYEVVQPHQHDWRIIHMVSVLSNDPPEKKRFSVDVQCFGCGEYERYKYINRSDLPVWTEPS
jgi:hypothetical protein